MRFIKPKQYNSEKMNKYSYGAPVRIHKTEKWNQWNTL